MIRSRLFYLASLVAIAALATTGCVSSSSADEPPLPKHEVLANAVEDTLAIGLVPVLVNNPEYVPVAQGISVALGAGTAGSMTTADIQAFLLKAGVADTDAATVSALVNATWDTYSRRYASEVGASVRPDVKLFLSAVANGISRAVAAIPRAAS